MAVAGDILEQPETGWKRYKRSEAVEIDYRLTHNDCLPIDWDSYISKSFMSITKTFGDNFKKDTKIRLIGSTLIAESQASVLVGTNDPPQKVTSFVIPANISGTNVILAELTVTEEMLAGYYIQLQLAGDMLYAIDVLTPTPTFEVMNIQPDSVDIGITLVERGQFRFTTVTEESGLVPIKEHFTYHQINYFIDIPYEGEVYTVENIDRYRTSLTSGNTGLIANTRYITYFYVDLEDKVYSVPFTTAALPKVTSSLPSGTYTSEKTILLSCETLGVDIRYTLDGTKPTRSSLLYSSPIVISTPTTIKAKAFKSGRYINSDILVLEINIIPVPTTTPTRYIQPPKITVREKIIIIESHCKVYYTTDGSYPNETSLHYTTPLSISPNTTTITAIAYSEKNLSFSHPSQYTLYPQNITTIYPPQ